MGENIGAGPRIRMWRKKADMKAYQLARQIKLSQGSLSDIENGKSNPSAETIVHFMKYTDIDIFWMLTGELDYVVGVERVSDIKLDPPFVINLNSMVTEVLIRRQD